MLQRIRIQDFRCLRNVDVPLQPLTVLIGPNDSGKTAFLRAIWHLAQSNESISAIDYWRLEPKATIRLHAFLAGGEVNMTAEFGKKPKITKFGENRSSPSRLGYFQLPSTGISMECAGYSDKDERSLMLDADGRQVPAFLDYLLRRDRKRFYDVVSVLRDYIPGLEDLDIATPTPATRRVDVVIENGLKISADAASAGVRFLLFFVALAYHPRPPETILVEEPECGLHPRRLADVMRLLREITQGKHGEHAAQVLLTTHSPYLLDSVDLHQDQVLVFQRNEDGSRSVEPVDAQRLKTYLDEFMLGEVWFNESEAGLLAKRS